jgi:hypothetical protein
MRIGIVGGVERNEAQYARIAALSGHTLLFHGGHMGGRGTAALESLVDAADLVIIVTDVNSHGAVQAARKRLRQHGRTPLLLRSCSPSRFTSIVAALETREATSQSST